MLSVTPHDRLSDVVLTRAIVKHYEVSKLIPLGIALSAVEQVAGKMAFGLRKLVSRFRRRWKESPDAAKLKGLNSLKKRLKEMNIDVSGSSPEPASGHADSMDDAADRVEELGNALAAPDEGLDDPKPAKKGFDWMAMAAKMQAHKASVQKEAPAPLDDAQPPVKVAAVKAAPVATPCRNQLPPFVLAAMEEVQAPAPFPVTSADDAEPTGNPADQKPAKSAKKKTGKGKKNQKKKGKGKPVVAGPKEEEALALLPQQTPSGRAEGAAHEAGHEAAPPAGAAVAPADHAAYVPGDFNKKRYGYIKKMREEHQMKFSEANAAWMHSDERAELLQNVPPSEMKKRKFI